MDRNYLLEKLIEVNRIYSPKKSTDDLEVLADIWFEDFGHMSDADFCECMRVTRRTCRWFPVPAEILDAYEDVINKKNRIAMEARSAIEHKRDRDPELITMMAKTKKRYAEKIADRIG